MANFTDFSYDTLSTRSVRVLEFFNNLEAKLASIGATDTLAHMDIYWDGAKVKIILTDENIAESTNPKKFKYYTQGLGLMKLAMNNKLYS